MTKGKGLFRYIVFKTRFKLDGILNESSWEDAVPLSGFIQTEPYEGAPATEKTVVKILYDEENLYIGVMCHDREPDKIIHNELRVDGALKDDDNFSLILDTFNDKRDGYKDYQTIYITSIAKVAYLIRF
ncbi:hypothetical protein ACFL1R_10385 [Candidatus Latescibacterota bacterium]